MNQQVYPRIYTRSKDLPEMDNRQFFHSRQLFEMCEQTKGQKPYMITVETADGKVAAHLLAVVRYRSSWFPPYFYMHCRMLGEGVYEVGYAQTELFELMLSTLKEKMLRRLELDLYYLEHRAACSISKSVTSVRRCSATRNCADRGSSPSGG